MKDFERALGLLKSDGISAVLHALVMKLKEREKEQTKYDKWIQRFEYQMPIEKAEKDSAFSITLIPVSERILDAIEEEKGDYYAFYYVGDSVSKEWEPIILAYLERNAGVKFLYTDEDFYSNGIRVKPILKPEWSPDTYLSNNYIGGLIIMERQLAIASAKRIKEQDASWDRYGKGILYALGLCVTEMLDRTEIAHVKRIIYHREINHFVDKEFLLNIKNDVIKRRKLDAFAEYEPRTGSVRVVYNPPNVKVSLIVPSKDQSSVLETCIESAEKYTDYGNYEWIIVDNGSSDSERKEYEALASKTTKPFTYIYNKSEFNFAAMCNTGAAKASGQCLVFLNDDIEFTDSCSHWLSRLVGHAMQPTIGVVGAKLLYPGTTFIQHIGVVNYVRGAAHILNRSDDLRILPLNRNCIDSNVSVATGALLGISKDKFDEVGGFCEELKVTYNDVELCFKLMEKGYYNVVRSDVVAYHHESLARGEDILDMTKYRRCLKEREKLFALHPQYIDRDDYYHPYLSQTDTKAGVSTHYLPAVSMAKKMISSPRIVDESIITGRIDKLDIDEWLYIKGFAFKNKPSSEQVFIVLEGENRYKFATKKVFNHTYTQLYNDGRSYSFISFETVIRHRRLPEDTYQVCIKIGQDMIKTNHWINV